MDLPDKTRKEINTWLRDLDNILVDLQQAKNAGVDGIDSLLDIANKCKNQCQQLKKGYWPNKP